MPRDGLCVFGVKEKMGTDSVDEYEEQSVPAVITQSGYGSRYETTISRGLFLYHAAAQTC